MKTPDEIIDRNDTGFYLYVEELDGYVTGEREHKSGFFINFFKQTHFHIFVENNQF